MDEIGKILSASLRKQIRIAEPFLLEVLLPLWPLIAGKCIAQHSTPRLFAAGVLTLESDSATWSAQLRHLSPQICVAVNSFVGKSAVKKLRIKTVVQPNLFSPSPLTNTAPPAPTLTEQTLDTTAIANPATAAAIARSYSKYFSRSRRHSSAWL